MRSSIALITEDFPPKDGGIAQWAYYVARHLGGRGHWVTVLVKGKTVKEPDDFRGEPFRVIRMRGRNFSAYKFFYTAYYVLKLRPGVLISLTWDLASSAVFVNHFLSLKIVVVAHGLDVTKRLTPARRWLCRKTLMGCSLIISVSRFTKERIMKRFAVPEDRIVVLPNGVDTTKFCRRKDLFDLRKRYGLKKGPVILTVARIIERKGHEKVIEAMPKVLKQVPEAVYLIGGSGSNRVERKLRERVAELRIEDHVCFIGYIPDNELSLHYSLCDLYVMPNREIERSGDTEGFGITFLEAGACGKPVVGGLSGGVVDAVVDGVTGLLVDPLNADAISDAIVRLLTDSALAERMGKRGRERIDREFTWQSVTRRLTDFLGLDEDRESDSREYCRFER